MRSLKNELKEIANRQIYERYVYGGGFDRIDLVKNLSDDVYRKLIESRR